MIKFTNNQLSAQKPVSRHECDGIFIRQNDYFRKYLYRDLLYVKACGCYCDLFVRLYHSYVVSLYDIDVWVGNSVQIKGEWIPVGHRYRAEFLSRLNILSMPRKHTPPTNPADETI